MADLAALQHGQPPWKPTLATETVTEYQYYSMPLCGVIRQDEREFLYMCLDGQDETLSLWWYVPISLEQREAIESSTPNDYDDLLGRMEFHGWTRLAFATPRVGIVDYEDVEDTPDGKAGLLAALRAMQARLDRLHNDAQRLELSSR